MADTIKTNLGPVTAYADAKAHGYTGTREEFGQLLANAGLNLKAAETAKEGAEAAKQAAETAQHAAAENQKNAGTHAENAKASADTAAEQANAAKESAAGAANSATAAQNFETNAGLSATAAANAEAAAKQAQNAAETAKTDAEAAKTAAGTSADAAAASAADAKKTLESIPADYSTLSGKVDDNTSGIRELKEDIDNLSINNYCHPIIVYGEYINKDNGDAIAYNGWSRTDYIECNSYAEIINSFGVKLTFGIDLTSYSAFYDQDKNFICNMLSCAQYDEEKNITSIFSPMKAKYYRMSATTDSIKKIPIKTNLDRNLSNISNETKLISNSVSNNTFIYCNHLNMDTIHPKTYLLSDTGNITFNQDGFFTSDFIDIKECYYGRNFKYVLAFDIENGKWGAFGRQIAFYDENRIFIRIWNTKQSDSTSIVEIPSNAKYIRVCFYEEKDQYYVGFQNNTNPPIYVPYSRKLLGYNIPDMPSIICNTDGAVSSMLMTATDYWENAEIRYGNNHTPFDDVCGGKYESNDGTYDGVAYQLDCSSFVTLCMRGIRFNCSRFLPNNTRNINSPNGFIWDNSVTYDNLLDNGLEDGTHERIYANNLAKYAYEHGYLYRVARDFSNVKAGDLLFNSNLEDWCGLKFWEKIGHVMLVCQVIPRYDDKNSVKVFQSVHGDNYGVFRTLIHPSEDTTIFYGARYPIGDCSYYFDTLYETKTKKNITYSGTAYKCIHEIKLDKPLTTGIYTLTFKANENDDKLLWEYWIGDANNSNYNIGSSGQYVKKRPDGFHEVHIEIPMSLTIDNPKRLRIFVKGIDDTNTEIEFCGAKLRKGYVTPSPFEFD